MALPSRAVAFAEGAMRAALGAGKSVKWNRLTAQAGIWLKSWALTRAIDATKAKAAAVNFMMAGKWW